MMRYRFPLLLAIYISYLGFVPNEVRLVRVKITNSQTLIIQTLEANAQDSSTQQGSAYDRYMRTGYEATQKKEYQKALEAFQKALSERTDDPYAQKALSNVKTYLDKNNSSSNANSKNNATLFGDNSIWLIIGLSFLVLATLGALISFLTLFNKRSKQNTLNLNKHQTSSEKDDDKEPQFPSPFLNNSNEKFTDNTYKSNSNSEQDFSLPVQNTTRLPSVDFIEELLKTLREPEAKTRRKAIWKLAQVSDSRAMKPLVDLMIETDSYERSLILEALSQVCSRTLRPMNQALAISLQDKNSQVRKNAIRDLTRLYDLMSQINELLSYALEDESLEVQETAKWALSKLNLRMPMQINLGNKTEDDDTMFEEDINDEDDENEENNPDSFKR